MSTQLTPERVEATGGPALRPALPPTGPAEAPPKSPARRIRDAAAAVFGSLWLIALLLVGWQLMAMYGSDLVPGPVESVQRLWAMTTDGRLSEPVQATMTRLVVGFTLGIMTAVPIGLAVGLSRVLDRAASPILLGLQSVPTIAWLPFAIIWFGLTAQAVLFIVWFGTAVPLAVATLGAVKQIPPLLDRASRVMGAHGFFRYRTFVLPAVVPGLISGLRLSWSFAWRSAMAAELIVAAPGLGQVLEAERNLNRYDGVAAVIMVIALLGIVAEQLIFRPIEDLVVRRYGLAARR